MSLTLNHALFTFQIMNAPGKLQAQENLGMHLTNTK